MIRRTNLNHSGTSAPKAPVKNVVKAAPEDLFPAILSKAHIGQTTFARHISQDPHPFGSPGVKVSGQEYRALVIAKL